MADEPEKKTPEADPWDRMKDLIGATVEEKLKAWEPPAANNSQPSLKPEETPPPSPSPESTPERQKTTRKEGFLSQFFKGLE